MNEPAEHQVELANRLEALFRQHLRYERRREPDRGNGPSILFNLGTRYPDLTVALELYSDTVHVYANEVEVRMLVGGPNGYEEYGDYVVSVLRELLLHPLRLRVLRPFFKWFPPEGSLFLWDGAAGGWSGNLFGIGRAKERVFEDWCDPPPGD